MSATTTCFMRLSHPRSDESLLPMYTLGGDKHCKMASVRDVQHETDPRNVGEPKTIKINKDRLRHNPCWDC